MANRLHLKLELTKEQLEQVEQRTVCVITVRIEATQMIQLIQIMVELKILKPEELRILKLEELRNQVKMLQLKILMQEWKSRYLMMR